MTNKITKLYHNGEEYYIDEYQEGWKPGANTVAYYKFDGNLNDSSGNGHNLTMYTGSPTYGTASGGGKYAYFNRNSWTNYWNRDVNYDGNNTISFYINPQENLSSIKTIVELRANSSNNFIRIHDTIAFDGNAITQLVNTPLSVGTRYLITATCDGSNFYFYKNGTLIGSSSKAISGTYNSRFRVNQVPDTNSSSYSNNMYISELIWEEKFWTAQEITDYYNQTKNLYGIN